MEFKQKKNKIYLRYYKISKVGKKGGKRFEGGGHEKGKGSPYMLPLITVDL